MSDFRTVDLRFRARYAETDTGGVVYYANYLVWFEMGRSEFCRAIGYPYTRIEEEGYLMVVAEATARYKRSAHYDDRILVRTTMPEIRKKTCRFHHQIFREDTMELLAEGGTVHVVVSKETGRTVSLPESTIKHFRKAIRAPL